MPRKFIFPILVLILAVLACSIQGAPLTPPPPEVPTDTSTPPTPSDTPLTPAPPVITDTPSGPAPAPGGITLDMLRNGTYHAPYYDRTITLVNGSYASGSYTVMMMSAYGFGDLNGDGKQDAAIILAENDGGSGNFESLVAVVDQGGAPHQESARELGDRVVISAVDISSGVIHLNMIVTGPSDPMCCPSLPEKQNYWLIGSTLWLMRLNSTIGGTERIINVDSPGIWSTVTNPFTVAGSLTVLPFENTLAYHVYLLDGTVVNEGSLIVTPAGGTSATFSHVFNLSAAGITDWVIIQFVDTSAADGSIIALGSVIMRAQ